MDDNNKKDKTMLPVIFGIDGYSLTEEEKVLFTKHQPHGIILFSRNCKSREQIISLNREIKALIPDVKIFIDQEGGKVARVKPPVAAKEFPNMEYFSKMAAEQGLKAAEIATQQNFFELMSELKELGIDVTCAPVCDLRIDGAHSVIGDRSFGSDVGTVIALCKAALAGIHKAGGEGVIKHIPGHGRSKVDSHFGLPVVDASLEELEKTDFAVFKALAKDCSYAMTAHIIYTCLDADLPATLSPKCIEYIRKEIGFEGLLMSDDIYMKALKGDVASLSQASLDAGCNLALCCKAVIDDMRLVCANCNDMPAKVV